MPPDELRASTFLSVYPFLQNCASFDLSLSDDFCHKVESYLEYSLAAAIHDDDLFLLDWRNRAPSPPSVDTDYESLISEFPDNTVVAASSLLALGRWIERYLLWTRKVLPPIPLSKAFPDAQIFIAAKIQSAGSFILVKWDTESPCDPPP